MAGFGWQHRSELPTTERDYGFQPYSVNPSGWSALATPGLFVIAANVGGIAIGGGLALRPDVGCTGLGGVQDGVLCRFSFIPFDNLIEETNRYQGYLQADVDLTDTFRFRGELSYAKTDMDAIGTSPGYPPLQGPGGARVGGGFTVSPQNPGALVFAKQTGLTGTPAFISVSAWRPFGWLGNPRDERGSGRQTANNEAFRFSGTFEKDFSDSVGAQLSLT